MIHGIHFGGWQPETLEYKASLPEERKFPALLAKPQLVAKAAPVAGVVDWRSVCPPIASQLTIGSCVGNAIAGCLEFLEMSEGMTYIELSRMFLYYNARIETGTTDKDDGCVIGQAMHTLTTIGVAPEATFPYDVSKVFYRPPVEAYREAFAHTVVQSYALLSTDTELHNDIKTAIDAKHPVVFGTPVWSSILSVKSDGLIPMPTSDAPLGGHAMLIVGYDLNQQVYIVRNSWGTGWGDKGYGYMPFAYLNAAPAADFWVATKYA